MLLMMSVFESPNTAGYLIRHSLHAPIELTCLTVIAIDSLLKMRWMGVKAFFSHARTSFKVLTLTMMIIEATVVMFESKSHFRVIRALRPVFLVDSHYCSETRR